MSGRGATGPRLRADTFAVERSDSPDGVVLHLSGELDMAAVDRFTAAAAGLPSGAAIVVELADLEFMDSSGLRVLMNLDLAARAAGSAVTLRAPQPAVLRLLRISGFDERFEITPR